MGKAGKIGIGVAAAGLVLFGIGMIGGRIFDTEEPPRPTATTTQQTQVNTTYRRPGATTTAATTAAPTASNGAKLVTKIDLTTYKVTVEVGQSTMPIVAMTPAEAADKREIWTSSDPAVATVDALGNIKGVKVGSCTVTVAAAANPSVKAEVAVTVKAAASTTSRPTTKSTAAESVDALVARVSAKVKQPTYIQGILIANKTYGLPRSFDPGADSDMLNAFSKMRKDAAKQGLSLVNSSNYRSYDDQVRLYKKYVSRDGQQAADTYSARPGFSEHQTGLVIDLNSVSDAFAGTPEANWVAKNAHKYGFIVRYPKGKEAITGYQYEPWHIRYLGVKTATAVYQSGQTLEEYLGVTSVYAD